MQRSHVILIIVGIGVALLSGGLIIWRVYKSDLWRGADAKFGDQHLKTSVALIELHKVRYRQYPQNLSELKFLGDWDPIAVGSVRYATNESRSRYCVTVERGWVAKPELVVPSEFWQNTGFDPTLCR